MSFWNNNVQMKRKEYVRCLHDYTHRPVDPEKHVIEANNLLPTFGSTEHSNDDDGDDAQRVGESERTMLMNWTRE